MRLADASPILCWETLERLRTILWQNCKWLEIMRSDTSTLRLNRVYLPIYGFMKEYEFPAQKGMFRDITSFEFIVEALIAHSAYQIVLESFGEKGDSTLLDNVPQALKKRIKFIDRDTSAVELAINLFSPVFDEFSVEAQGEYALSFKSKKLPSSEVRDALATSYFSLHPFLLGLRHKLQVDIDIDRFKRALSVIRERSKNPEGRANVAVLEGILNCYSSGTIDGLKIVPGARNELVESFINFLEDSSFQELSRANFELGFPLRFRKSVVRIKQTVRKIVSSEKFRLLVAASSKAITAATRVPLPDADLAKTIVPSHYLPPVISLEPILSQARTLWERSLGDKNLAERYERSKLLIKDTTR